MGAVLSISLNLHLADIQKTSELPADEVAAIVHNPSALIDTGARANLPATFLRSMQSAMGGALHNVFLVGVMLAGLALLSGFWLPAHHVTQKPSDAEPHVASSARECEQLLMAEMTTLDAEHEPVAVEGD
jgi:hypothetical protein